MKKLQVKELTTVREMTLTEMYQERILFRLHNFNNNNLVRV